MANPPNEGITLQQSLAIMSMTAVITVTLVLILTLTIGPEEIEKNRVLPSVITQFTFTVYNILNFVRIQASKNEKLKLKRSARVRFRSRKKN